jgi:hypothetical protein
MKKEMTPEMLVMVGAVRGAAHANYESSYGWQEIFECYDRHEIAEELEDNDITTAEAAIAYFTDLAKLRTEYAQEIESTAW